MTEPTEATPEPVQTSTKNAIEILIKAHKLAEIATGYKASTQKLLGTIYYDQGRNTEDNSTLLAYIKKAEAKIVKEKQSEIIAEAREIIKAELDAIKELLK